jgi:DNA-binding transcriptional ArsR family regulator
MAFPKNDQFPLDDQAVSNCGRALGHPARVYILRLLEREGPKQVIQLVKALPLTEGTVTAHLKRLRLAGLINVEVRGLTNYYSLNVAGLAAVFELQKAFFRTLRIDSRVTILE